MGGKEAMKYIYPAVFTPEENGFSVEFPDLPGCVTAGEDLNDAMYMANDALCLWLYDKEATGEDIPAPSEVNALRHTNTSFVSLIPCDTDFYRRYYSGRSVKKTLSIPEWLNYEACANGINFSQLLQDALKEALGIKIQG